MKFALASPLAPCDGGVRAGNYETCPLDVAVSVALACLAPPRIAVRVLSSSPCSLLSSHCEPLHRERSDVACPLLRTACNNLFFPSFTHSLFRSPIAPIFGPAHLRLSSPRATEGLSLTKHGFARLRHRSRGSGRRLAPKKRPQWRWSSRPEPAGCGKKQAEGTHASTVELQQSNFGRLTTNPSPRASSRSSMRPNTSGRLLCSPSLHSSPACTRSDSPTS